MNILIVDDDPEVLDALETRMSLKGHNVDALTESQQALNWIENNKYHAVFLDINMPEPDGIDLLHEIREKDPTAEIVMVTAFNSLDKTMTARQLGASEYLLKPLEDPDQLERVLEQLEQRHRRWTRADKEAMDLRYEKQIKTLDQETSRGETDMDVLIVDDDKQVLESLETHLSLQGYEAVTADESTNVMDTLEKRNFDCVLLDINMPQIDGINLLKQINQFDPTIEIIMMTGFNSLDKTMDAREYGASEYLLKPFNNMDELDTVLKQAQDRVQRWNQAHEEAMSLESDEEGDL